MVAMPSAAVCSTAGHQRFDHGSVLRWGIDGAAAIALERSAGQLAEAGAILFQLGLDLQDVIVGEQAARAYGVETDPQRLAVVRNLLAGSLGKSDFTEQFVVGGDDVLDLGAVLGLLEAQRADQDALIRHRGGDTLELGQLAAGGIELLEDVRPVKSIRSQGNQGLDCSHLFTCPA